VINNTGSSCPSQYSFSLTTNDYDLGAAGVTMIKSVGNGFTSLCGSSNGELVAGGKEGVLYGICYNPSPGSLGTMGGLDSCGYNYSGTCLSNLNTVAALTACTQATTPTPGKIAQCFFGTPNLANQSLGKDTGNRGTIAFWGGSASSPQNYLYVAGTADVLRAYQYLPGGTFATPGAQDSIPHSYAYPGATPSVSWNGVTADTTTGLVWAIDSGPYGRYNLNTDTTTKAGAATLFGYKAIPDNLGTTLTNDFNSSTITLPPGVTNYGPGAVKFTAPTIAAGLVFVGGGEANPVYCSRQDHDAKRELHSFCRRRKLFGGILHLRNDDALRARQARTPCKSHVFGGQSMKSHIAAHQFSVLLSMIFVSVAFVSAQNVQDIVSLTGNNSLGTPDATPVQERNGELYETCPNPKDTYGSIFSLTTEGVVNTLYLFNSTGGFDPRAGLTLDTDGNFYGTGAAGGSGTYGVLFRISPRGTYTVLHDFLGGSDGAGPEAVPIEGSDGNLYGTTSGAAGIFSSTVYRYTHSGTYTTIYQFNNAQAESILAPLIQGSDGNLYGTSWQGGAYLNGSIYKLSTSGTLLYLYSFPASGLGGAFPFGSLVQASDGNFYGTTQYGGKAGGNGTIFRMTQKGKVSVMYSFTGNGDGANPSGGLIQATNGNLYGTTSAKGTYGYGTIFQISLSGSLQTLYSFSSAIGENPGPPPLQHTNGLFYGSLPFGSTYGFGAIYSFDMGLGPFITFVQPTGKVGKTAEILGQGFTGTTSVTFNGVLATSFAVKSDTYMTAVVPTGATTGPAVVITPSGTLTSNVNFRISK
jgi:uncharacterized repeat protein (TIGR03803 family)